MLNEALRLIRVFHDLNQREAAEKLEISNSYLSEIESGKKIPNTELIERYARVFDLPVSSIWFFYEHLEAGTQPDTLQHAKGVIAEKVLSFLRIVEMRSEF